MSDIKKSAIQAIQNLPDDTTFEDIMEAIYVQQKIAIGLQQSKDGNVTSHTDFVKEIETQQGKRKKLKK